jgi:hypothetical protein
VATALPKAAPLYIETGCIPSASLSWVNAEESFDLDAAGLRADDRDAVTSLEVLATKLEEALPTHVRVERRGRGLFGREKQVERIEVRLGECVLSLRRARGRIEGWREREVGGISIKREPLGVDAWVNALEQELREVSGRSTEAREALARLLS